MKNLLLASTSTVHGSGFLEYLLPELKIHFKNVSSILFIPYARPSGVSHDDYTKKVTLAFNKINKAVIGIHEFNDPKTAIASAEGIFTGGGNTFVLLKQLQDLDLIPTLQKVLNNGVPYLGTSAGTNICGLTIRTTNDMPIVYPNSFNALGLVPFNINPHYLDPDSDSTHMGETRETRINEFHHFNTTPVVGLREGSYLIVRDKVILLKGDHQARIFQHQKLPYELNPNAFINFD